MIANRFVGATALGCAALLGSATALAATQVVTSLKPIELLVKAVAADDVEVTTLVQPGASPHNYTMKPSQRRALENADAIFWVGPELETFLTRLLSGNEFRDRTYSLMHGEDIPEIETEDDHGGHDDHAGHGHDHGDGEDPHIWLDPALALDMARDIHKVLVQQDGADVAALDANLKRFERDLSTAESDITTRLKPVAEIDLFTYHNAFTRFAEHYGLTLQGILTLNPELSPGARHIAEVQQKLQEANHPCLMTEPQFNRQWWRSITEGLDITFSTWDPLATDIEPGRDGYITFQQSLADAALRCLPENAQ
ncbi:ABC transporter substrate-binding protein [Marinobacter panjinensis]|uniref:High-affinity zinc uptake system protein ZnuA n=1 Tax=Marinobacter panjinensis TaxID=2576384 RepID=A0A4U6R290_9GAMM|nr:zinc ABC transporter substrate-binding protein [Marinobacter panjinensis]MCR8913871.1 zinc ABC transporter substrate-binding protein [Marinobacter panjinensis]TKV67491.1 ABC transporter substrate-binding protein [Marinobacter panjinensis]